MSFNTTVAGDMEEELSGLYKFHEGYGQYHGYVSCVVCLFGMVANMANIIVLTRKNMMSSTNIILMWLAVADLLTMLSYFPFALYYYILNQETTRFVTRSYAWVWQLLFHANFTIICHTIAIWLTIALAIFRYICICYPTKGIDLCSLQRAKLATFLIYFCTVVICIPNYIVNEIVNIATNGTVSNYIETPLYTIEFRNSTHIDSAMISFNYWVQALLIKLIPCMMLTILTVLLIKAMHRAYMRRMKLKSQGRKDESDRHGEHNRTTGMLLAVVVLFLLTELPQGILTLLIIFNNEFLSTVYNPLGDLWDIAALCNNAINFVLYCSMSKQFRDTFTKIFCSWVPKHRPGWLKMQVITATQNGTQASNNNTGSTSV